MTDYSKYFGGTGITLDKLQAAMPTINVDGTTYRIEDWLRECARFDKLIPGKDKLWIPYQVWERGTVTEVVWARHEFSTYKHTDETKDWWVAEPHAKVRRDGHDGEYFVYEITFYKNWRRKTQMKHLLAQGAKPKRKFLSQRDMADLKRFEAAENSKNKRTNIK